MPIGQFPEILSQRILVGIILVGRPGGDRRSKSGASPTRYTLRQWVDACKAVRRLAAVKNCFRMSRAKPSTNYHIPPYRCGLYGAIKVRVCSMARCAARNSLLQLPLILTDDTCYLGHLEWQPVRGAKRGILGNRATDEGLPNWIVGLKLSYAKRHQKCHFRKRATSAPAEGPAYGLDFARHCDFFSELCSRRSAVYTEVARLVPPDALTSLCIHM